MSKESQQEARSQATEQTVVESSPPQPWVPYADSGYLLGPAIASGGMGSVHLGLKQGALGFRRLLAIKRLHGHLARDPEFVARFKDEIRLVSRLNHPNIVQTFDVLEIEHELALVMEYVEGVTLYQLIKDADAAGARLPVEVVVGVLAQALHGLHSAHELSDASGRPLQLVHRDVSPQNIMVAKDGLAKVLDFGVAKAASETHVTRTGQLSGKAAYMSPEQALGHPVDRRTDVFAAGIVLWEALTGQRLFRAAGMPEAAALRNVLEMRVRSPSELRPDISPALERVALRALERDPTRRYGSARDFALGLEEVVPNASLSAVASGVMVVSRQRLLDISTGTAGLPPETNGFGAAEIVRLPPRAAALAMQNDVTRPIEGISVEPSPARRSSRAGLLALALLTLAGAAVLVVGKMQREPLAAPVVVERAEGRLSPEVAPGPVAAAAGVNVPVSKAASAAETKPAPPSGSSNATTPKAATPESSSVAAQSNVSQSTGATRGVARVNKPAASHKRLQVTPAVTVAQSKSNPKCSPPTFTDADGIRHFKPECL